MIKFDDQFARIKNEAIGWWGNCPNAIGKMAQFHGCELKSPPINEHGVFENSEKIVIIGDNCDAEIRYVKTPAGHWLNAIAVNMRNFGYSALPSIFSHVGYETSEEAIDCALKDITRRANEVLNTSNFTADKNAAESLIDAIDEYCMSFNQLSLF